MLFIIMISAILYIASLSIIYHNVNNFEKSKKVMFLLIGSVIVLILTYILCIYTSKNINYAKELVDITKNTAVLIFAPLNSIIFLAPIGNTLNKLKSNEMYKSELIKRIFFITIIGVIVIFMEFNYIRNFQIGLLNNANQ